MRRRRHYRPAFTLVELLVIMTGLTVALVLLAVILGGALRLEGASSQALQRLAARRDLADRFRADVTQATEAPERWGGDMAGAGCLILRFDAGGHVVYRWEEDRLVRLDFTGEEVHQQEVTRGAGTTPGEFGRSGRLLTLRVFGAGRDGGRQTSAEIAAALGGDLQ
jgi:hypothetical protein